MYDTITLVKVNVGANNNKFYELSDAGSGMIRARWGRVGTNGQSQTYPSHMFHTKLHEKLKKGYEEFSRSHGGSSATPKTSVKSAEGDHAQIAVIINSTRHVIADIADGHITVSKSGSVRTALGVVTAAQLSEARSLLRSLVSEKANGRIRSVTKERYLTLIPQKIADVVSDAWITTRWLSRQSELLNALGVQVMVSDALELQAKTSPEEFKSLMSDAYEGLDIFDLGGDEAAHGLIEAMYGGDVSRLAELLQAAR